MLVKGAEQPAACADKGRQANLAVHMYVYKATVQDLTSISLY